MKKLSPIFLSALLSTGMVLQSTSVAFAAPHEVYGRIIVNSADYFLDTDIDEFGNARIFPSKTTFSESDATSGATKPAKRVTIHADKGENAVYTYASGQQERYQDWAENITRITYLSYDWEDIIRKVPSDLNYQETKEGLVLKTSKLPIGIYTVRIYANESDTFVLNLEVQQEAPTIQLSGEAKANAKTSFILNGMEFSWKSAINEVILNGNVLDAEQYTTVSNVITLSEGVLSKTGENTLTVKSYGYKDANFTFNVKAASPVINAGNVMAISSATSSGGGVDGTSGASGVVPAFLVFNFDLLANAQILEQHNMATEASTGVLALWEEANKEVLRGAGSMKLYDWDSYIASGKSFEEHVENDGQRATAADGIFWDMWEVKNVLENGKLGDPYDFYEQIAAPHPEITEVTAAWGNGIVLTFGDISSDEFSAWADGIRTYETKISKNAAAVKVDSNGLYYGTDYSVDKTNQQLTLPAETLHKVVSANSTLIIRSSGSKTINHKISFASGTFAPELVAEAYYVGDNVEIKNIPSDMENIVMKNGGDSIEEWYDSGKNTYFTFEKVEAGQEGEEATANGKFIINSANFTEAGTYNIKIQSANYAPQVVKVKILDAENKPGFSIGDISNVVLDDLTVGYETPTAHTIEIKNTGNQVLTELTATLAKGDESNFTLGTLETTALEPNDTVALVVTPNEDLPDGTYTDTVTVSAIGLIPKTFTVTQKVVTENSGGTIDPDANYDLSVTEDNLMPLLKSGYSDAASTFITIENTGDAKLTGLSAEVSGDYADAFTVELDNTALETGGTTTLKVTPQASLAIGNHRFTVKLSANELKSPVEHDMWQTVHMIQESKLSSNKISISLNQSYAAVTAVVLNGTPLTKNGSGSPQKGEFYPISGKYSSVTINPATDTPENAIAELTIVINKQSYTFTVQLNTTTGELSPVGVTNDAEDNGDNENDNSGGGNSGGDNSGDDNSDDDGGGNNSGDGSGNEPEVPLGENEYYLGQDVTIDVSDFFENPIYNPTFSVSINNQDVTFDQDIENKTITLDSELFELDESLVDKEFLITIGATFGFYPSKSSKVTITIKAPFSQD